MNGIIATLSHELERRGLDLTKTFRVGKYNEYFNNDKCLKLNTSFSKYGDNSLAVLVGNTKAIWKPFVSSYVTQYENEKNPLDKYVFDSVHSVLDESFPKHKVYFSHEMQSENKPVVAIQRAAHISKLAFYDDQCTFLSIHKKYGPWIALRCVIVFELEYIDEIEGESFCNPCGEDTKNLISCAMREAFDNAHDWRMWLKMRDVCGKDFLQEYRYSVNQIEYHYTKNKLLIN
ncbi:methylmalonic aciduria and homocystinuria type C protein [Acrasis kona]|uniref:Cyanocobalamin reductase (cyanide-eliminating) n=1 Tax=Acrasis kona TaxID=1008807 RepID=A0AAW2Z198_9EUKA